MNHWWLNTWLSFTRCKRESRYFSRGWRVGGGDKDKILEKILSIFFLFFLFSIWLIFFNSKNGGGGLKLYHTTSLDPPMRWLKLTRYNTLGMSIITADNISSHLCFIGTPRMCLINKPAAKTLTHKPTPNEANYRFVTWWRNKNTPLAPKHL